MSDGACTRCGCAPADAETGFCLLCVDELADIDEVLKAERAARARAEKERDEAVEWQKAKAEWIEVATRTLVALSVRVESAERDLAELLDAALRYRALATNAIGVLRVDEDAGRTLDDLLARLTIARVSAVDRGGEEPARKG